LLAFDQGRPVRIEVGWDCSLGLTPWLLERCPSEGDDLRRRGQFSESFSKHSVPVVVGV
jgi:hypothetical protein